MDDAMRAASTVGIVGDPFEGKLGGFNEMPPNWTTITQSEFHWKFGMDSGRRLVFRQVMLPTARHGELTIDPKRVRWCNV